MIAMALDRLVANHPPFPAGDYNIHQLQTGVACLSPIGAGPWIFDRTRLLGCDSDTAKVVRPIRVKANRFLSRIRFYGAATPPIRSTKVANLRRKEWRFPHFGISAIIESK